MKRERPQTPLSHRLILRIISPNRLKVIRRAFCFSSFSFPEHNHPDSSTSHSSTHSAQSLLQYFYTFIISQLIHHRGRLRYQNRRRTGLFKLAILPKSTVNMSSNTILKIASIGTAQKAGRAIALSAATETHVWRRSEDMARKAAIGLKEAVEAYTKPMPVTLPRLSCGLHCSRHSFLVHTFSAIFSETQHQSPADERLHYTAEAWDDKGNFISTVHVSVKK